MSTFYIRNIVRGNYSGFLNLSRNRHSSMEVIENQTSIEDDSLHTSKNSNSTDNVFKSENLPVSMSFSASIQDKVTVDATEPCSSNYSNLPEVDVNLNPPSPAKYRKYYTARKI